MLSSLALETLTVPQIHRRHPFDLHWRQEPPEWAGNLKGAYGRLYSKLLTASGEQCCLQCGAVPCPYDHEQDERVRLADLKFVRDLAEQRKSLLAQVAQLQEQLKKCEVLEKTWNQEKEEMQRLISKLQRINNQQTEELANYNRDKKRLLTLSTKVKMLEEQNKQLTGENAGLKQSLNNCLKEVERLTTEFKKSASELEEAKRDTRRWKVQLDESNEAAATLRYQLTSSEDTAMKAQAEAIALREKLGETTRTMKETQMKNKQTINDLENLVMQLQRTLSESQEANEELQRCIDKQRAIISDLHRQLANDARFREFVDAKRMANELRDENEELRQKLPQELTFDDRKLVTINGRGLIDRPRQQSPAYRNKRPMTASYSVHSLKNILS